MGEEKKMLVVLNPANRWHRLIRRGIVMGALAFVAIVIKETVMPITPQIYIPLLVAVLAIIDKFTRTLQEKKE